MKEMIRQLLVLADAHYDGDAYGMVVDWANDAQEELDEVSGTGDAELDAKITAIIGDTDVDELLEAMDQDGAE